MFVNHFRGWHYWRQTRRPVVRCDFRSLRRLLRRPSGGGGGGGRHSGGATHPRPSDGCVPRRGEATAVRRRNLLVRPRRVVTVAATVARLAIFATAAVLFQLSQGAEHSLIAHRRGLPDTPNEERKSVAQASPFDRQFRHFQSPPSEHRSHRQFFSFEVPRLENQRCFPRRPPLLSSQFTQDCATNYLPDPSTEIAK